MRRGWRRDRSESHFRTRGTARCITGETRRSLFFRCAQRAIGFRGHRARATARALRAAAIDRLADRTAAALARQVDVAKLDRTLMRIREIALKELCTHSEADVQLQASFMLKNSRLEPIYEDT